MLILEPTHDVRGTALPFPTFENDPPRAVERGMEMIRSWCGAIGVTSSALVNALEQVALKVACARPEDITDESELVEYSTFARLASSLWQLRSHPDYTEVARTLVTTEDPDNFVHDEILLFLASKIIAGGLSIVPVANTTYGLRNPDLIARAAMVRGGDLYFELKARSPEASRELSSLETYIPHQIRKASQQIAARDLNARGFAVVDLGRVYESQLPDTIPTVTPSLETYSNLYGVMICSTLCKRLVTPAGDFFVPVFRSHVVDVEERVHQGDDRLDAPVIKSLHSAFKPPPP